MIWIFILWGAGLALLGVAGFFLTVFLPEVIKPLWLSLASRAVGITLLGALLGIFCFALSGGLV